MCSNCSGDYENPAMTQPEEDECEFCFHPVHKGVCEFERGDAPGDGEHCAVAFPPCGCKHGQLERASTQAEVNAAIEQEQILEASRSVRQGYDMLFSALRKNGVL